MCQLTAPWLLRPVEMVKAVLRLSAGPFLRRRSMFLAALVLFQLTTKVSPALRVAPLVGVENSLRAARTLEMAVARVKATVANFILKGVKEKTSEN